MSNSNTGIAPGLDERGKFAKGNTLSADAAKQRNGPKQKGSIDGLRQDVLDHWANSDAGKVLTKVKNEKPVEYIKAVTALAPKQSDAIITRNVVFALAAKGPPADWKPMSDEEMGDDNAD